MIDKVRDGGKPASRNRPCPRQPLVLMQRGLRVVVAAVVANPSHRPHLNPPRLWQKIMVLDGETPAKLNLHRQHRRRRRRREKRQSPHQLHRHHRHHRRQRRQPSGLFCCQRNNKMELPHRHRRHHHPQRPSHPKSNRLHKQNHHRRHLNQKRALFVPNRKLRLLFLLCLRPHSLRRVR